MKTINQMVYAVLIVLMLSNQRLAGYTYICNDICEDDSGRSWKTSLCENDGEKYADIYFEPSTTNRLKVAFPSRVKSRAISSTYEWYPVRRVSAASSHNLCEVVIPSSVTLINSFGYNYGLTNVVFAGNSQLRKLGFGAFDYCYKLSQIILPASLKEIEKGAFANCASLKSLIIPNSVTNCDSIFSTVSSYKADPGVVSLTLGSGIELCGGFYGLKSLTNVVWKKSPMSRTPSFQSCTSLKRISLPDSICEISDMSFYDCSSLEEIALPNSVTNIRDQAFGWCTSLREIRLPPYLKKLGERAFTCDHLLSRVIFTGDLPNCPSNIYYNAGDASANLTTYVQKNKTGWDEYVAAGSWCGHPIRYRSYTVSFNGNGATSGTMDDTEVYYGEQSSLPANKFFKSGYALAGWATAPTNPIAYQNEQVMSNIVEEIDGQIVLYAIWEPMEDPVITPGDGATFDADECTVTLSCGTSGAKLYFSTNGMTPRTTSNFEYTGPFVISNTCTLKVVAVKGNSKSNYVTATITKVDPIPPDAPVISPTDGSTFSSDVCTVTIACATDGTEIYYSTDGTTPRVIEANRYTAPFVINCTTTIKAVAVRNKVKSGYVTATITKKILTIGEALETGNLTFTTSNGSPWTPVADATAVSNETSVMSGCIGILEESWIETTITGAGTLTFWWKVDCEWDDSGDATWDHLMYEIDGVEQDRIDGTTDWKKIVREFTDGESHTIRWTYVKDGYDEDGASFADCGWIDSVNWVQSVNKEPIPDIGDNPTTQQIEAALEGSTDTKLSDNITDGTTYRQYRDWASKVKAKGGSSAVGADAVKNAPNAWLSFALGSETLIETAPADGDLKVDSFEPATESGKFDFTVSVKDIEVGSDAAADNLEKVFGIEGGTTLKSGGLSSDNVNITFGTPENGKVKFTAGPKNTSEGTFFMKVKMTP